MAIKYNANLKVYNDALQVLSGKQNTKRHRNLCTSAGAPVNNTDIPNRKGDLCYDTTNKNVYVCTVTNLTSTSTWIQIN